MRIHFQQKEPEVTVKYFPLRGKECLVKAQESVHELPLPVSSINVLGAVEVGHSLLPFSTQSGPCSRACPH